MRRTLVASLVLVAAVSAPAAAQTCLGLASHSAGQMQVTGNASFTDLANTFGGTFGYGLPSGVFGKAGVATTSYDGVDGSAIDLGAQAGYQMSVGKAAICPVASFSLGMGPKDIDGAGTDLSSRQGTFGLAVGTAMGASQRMQIVPAVSLGLAYRSDKIEDATSSLSVSETYAQAGLGVGLVFNQNITVRPSVTIPVGLLGNNDPTFGLTVGMNFGSKR